MSLERKSPSAGGPVSARSYPISQWPSDERPRERLLERGADGLSDAQLVAIVLRTGRKRQSAVELAARILSEFGDLRGVAQASTVELCRIDGVGPAKAAQLKAAQELGRRVASTPLRVGAPIESSAVVFEHFGPLLKGLKQERFVGLYLDGKHRIVLERTISEGSLTASLVHPREAFAPAVRASAAAVIFLHNHPSGDESPSREDRELTSRLAACGRLLGIPMLDHIVIGADRYFSFADHRLMEPGA
ncbi:MAG: RadC family protein [Nitrospirota bacterium]